MLIHSNVSVLFSEPKIPQSDRNLKSYKFAAQFQCSSASRKFLNVASLLDVRFPQSVSVLFSEPKIPQSNSEAAMSETTSRQFQCSSASRKFLNARARESCRDDEAVSVLFSEPKFLNVRWLGRRACFWQVSVLFSEPKIPQYDGA